MPNFEGIGLQNFRTFTKIEELKFAPITIITGTNNAGKSSVFKAIEFLVHNFKDGINAKTLDFKTMQHQLGDLERVYNRGMMAAAKKSNKPSSQHMYTRLRDFEKQNKTYQGTLPVFNEDEDLVFSFPIKLGNSREIDATLEIRYNLDRSIPKNAAPGEVSVSHSIKHVAILKDGEYLHWTNIIEYRVDYEGWSEWEMKTSLDLKKIIKMVMDTALEKKDRFEPNEKTEEYFTLDLFNRIEKYKHAFFDLPFFRRENDGYDDFKAKFIPGKSLFSNYSALTATVKSALEITEKSVFEDLFLGKDNNQSKVLECFQHSFSNILSGMEINIALADQEIEKTGIAEESDVEKEFSKVSGIFTTSPNSQLFTTLMGAIENDFFVAVKKKIDSLNKVYFLPTARGRGRAWFIDEQNSEDIQLAREFSSIYPDRDTSIQNFINFWIGKGEIDEKGTKKLKGFNIGKELSVFRDEEIGLTRIFLVNFDGTKTPLVDLGYGVSQLLPIIMKIAIVAYNHQMRHEYDFNNHEGYPEKRTIYFNASTLLIEEPEANLHPSLQSKMAELLIDAASRFNIQFLLETHSEYLIYKFQEYIGRKIVSPEDVKMYYFNHPDDVAAGLKDRYISHVQIDKDGSIDYQTYFGKGFFDEQTELKMSLLNIQRNSFIADYDANKEELKKSVETIKDYDAKIGQLNLDLSTANSGKRELEEELAATQSAKAESESLLQDQITAQEAIIDQYTAKTDLSAYQAEVEQVIDISKINHSKTLRYLSTGKFLLNNLVPGADFAPVVLQYGRAVEFEMIKWIYDFKNPLTATQVSDWCNVSQYTNAIRQLFTDLGITLIDNDSNYQLAAGEKINIFPLRNYISNTDDKSSFGGLTQIFELLHYLSPTKDTTFNYHSVVLLLQFSNYLRSIFSDYDSAEALFNTCRQIVNLRNCAGHTYTDSICINDIIDKNEAEQYIARVEAFFGCL
ncbi:DUF3696 domain-containing protein [Pedobacter rhizosphaerae]|uniref:AAA domain-containing protein n=1 Tax=Pedobacter rhizosphaerae TaxID=390241 RepID=A0A1H9WBM2_9SPHI|nr:DUF3696 domain-containing protein [Pedobacter rhizosphaerae]SES31181.1 AAA domain-containing protein [Pedobacter rhizosphaerae]